MKWEGGKGGWGVCSGTPVSGARTDTVSTRSPRVKTGSRATRGHYEEGAFVFETFVWTRQGSHRETGTLSSFTIINGLLSCSVMSIVFGCWWAPTCCELRCFSHPVTELQLGCFVFVCCNFPFCFLNYLFNLLLCHQGVTVVN